MHHVESLSHQFQRMVRVSPESPPGSSSRSLDDPALKQPSHHRRHRPNHYQADLYQATPLYEVEQAGRVMEPLPLVGRLIDDLERLWHDHETADVVFVVGHQAETVALYAHRAILRARCQSFQNVKASELCQMYGVTVTHDGNANVIRWPEARGECLREVLRYIYTSKFALVSDQANWTYQTLAIGYELGVGEVVALCEQHALATVTPHNVFAHLDAMIQIRSRLAEEDWLRLSQLCMEFISVNAAECVKSDAFLAISKETIVYLLSSDYFSLDEADVFRSTLAWAKYQTGVSKSTEQWSEEDRERISAQLSGVINHIRILLIDSQVFAEEVEPTGVIPIELSLERYRHAALAGKHALEGKRLQPRLYQNHAPMPIVCRLFASSKLLVNYDLKCEHTLNEWFGVPHQTWRLVFRASEHRFSAEAFHRFCDGVAPTYLIVLGTKGYLSGGFSDVAWASGSQRGRGCYVSSDKAFLFRLYSPESETISPVRFDVRKKMFAIGHVANCGPVFGAGADLMLTDQCHHNEESYSNLPHSYDGEDASSESLFGDYNFMVIDYEVFTPN